MARIVAIFLLVSSLATAGCTVPETCYYMFGRDHYSASTMGERDGHFRREVGRWEEYELEK